MVELNEIAKHSSDRGRDTITKPFLKTRYKNSQANYRGDILKENEWVAGVVELLDPMLHEYDERLSISQGTKLSYAYEIRAYEISGESTDISKYETDILDLLHKSI